MALKKSQLYGYLWQSCDELRGGMDASQYKDYVLTLLFVKYVSDRYAGQPDPVIVVPPGGGFADLVALKGNKEIGDQMNVVIAALADANDGFKGVIDLYDFNDENKLGRGQEMVDRLTKLVGIFQELDFRTNRAEGDDLLGDAYEYLMRNFATESGKSKGQFYTPAEVSRVMARIIGIGPQTRQDQTIYDPTCGSGSLLLKAADEAPKGITIYGQENDNATWALARQNMFLHNQPGHEIWKGNTLAAPHFHRDGRLQTFDFVVANPPFSLKNWTSGFDPAHDVFERFEMGVPPAKNGDYAFLLHVIKSLKSAGKAAIILPHGVLFRGNAEGEIRRKIVRQGLIKGIIGLPPNLFYGTGIPACIIVIDKERAHARSGIFIVDASQGYIQDGNKNRLREQDIRKLVDVFNQQLAVPQYSRLVPYSEIAANDYNLNIPRYIDSGAAEDRHDLEAHLHGGIPQGDVDALEPYWAVSPSLRAELFAPGDRPGYLTPRLAPRQLKAAIQANADFAAYATRVEAVF
ncbi:MAG TPA: type I restriction-modification system subunit M, partial [Anaerolineaceae bacterium]|nr:type I restriction-modification system subunit M [Anaerolineaceae bacterium]